MPKRKVKKLWLPRKYTKTDGKIPGCKRCREHSVPRVRYRHGWTYWLKPIAGGGWECHFCPHMEKDKMQVVRDERRHRARWMAYRVIDETNERNRNAVAYDEQ